MIAFVTVTILVISGIALFTVSSFIDSPVIEETTEVVEAELEAAVASSTVAGSQGDRATETEKLEGETNGLSGLELASKQQEIAESYILQGLFDEALEANTAAIALATGDEELSSTLNVQRKSIVGLQQITDSSQGDSP